MIYYAILLPLAFAAGFFLRGNELFWLLTGYFVGAVQTYLIIKEII